MLSRRDPPGRDLSPIPSGLYRKNPGGGGTMRHPATYYIPKPEGDEETSFQCRHIHTDGRRCGSPCLRNEAFCYYHHTTRKPVAPSDLAARKARSTNFALLIPDERSSIQAAIGEVLQRIAANEIDVKRAGLLLYGLQIASLNLPKPNPKAELAEQVEEIVLDPTYGPLALPARIGKTGSKGPAELFLEKLDREKAAKQEAARQQAERTEELARAGETTITTIQAVAEDPAPPHENSLRYTGFIGYGECSLSRSTTRQSPTWTTSSTAHSVSSPTHLLIPHPLNPATNSSGIPSAPPSAYPPAP